MSGFLFQMAGSLASVLPGVVSELLGTTEGATAGSLPVILAALENAGLGEKVKSWLGPEENLAVSASELVEALPPEQLNALATKVGLPPDQVAEILAQVLPHAADHASPDGRVQTGAAAPDVQGLLGKFEGR